VSFTVIEKWHHR